MWSSRPREGLAVCRAKVVHSFLGYFTSSIGTAPGIEPRPPPLQSCTLIDSANPAALTDKVPSSDDEHALCENILQLHYCVKCNAGIEP